MAPMQWRAATVGGRDTTGFEAFGSVIRQESDIRQVQVGNIGQTSKVSVADQFMAAGPDKVTAAALPVGLDLPCTEDPELFFTESPQDVEQAKAMCRECRARIACLTGALDRREPWGPPAKDRSSRVGGHKKGGRGRGADPGRAAARHTMHTTE